MEQPRALRLADGIADRRDWYEFDPSAWCPQAAAELRRQHAQIAELVEALDGAYSLAIGHAATYRFQHNLSQPHKTHSAILEKASAALSKAKEQ